MLKHFIKSTFALLIAAAMMLTLTSCNPFSGLSSIRTLMRPPSLTSEQTELTEALEKQIGKNIILKYPKSGDNRAAFVESDIDGDGDNEVVAFHMTKDIGSDIRMNILEKENDDWIWVCDTADLLNDSFSRTDILSISFEDLDNDGKKEILTSWYQSTSKNNCLTVFKYDNKQLIHMLSIAHTSSIAVDLDSDGINELFVTNLDYSTQSGEAFLYKYSGHNFKLVDKTDIDGKVTSYAQIKSGNLYKTNTTAVFIDGYKSANEMITEVVFLKDGKLYNPFFSPADISPTQTANSAASSGSESATGMTMATYRSNTLTVVDINNDGYLDIPQSIELPSLEGSTSEIKIWLTTYFSYNGNSAERVFTGIVDSTEGYSFELPQEWLGGVSAVCSRGERTLSVFERGNSQQEDYVLTIKTFLKNDWDYGSHGGYYYLAQSGDESLIYAVKTNDTELIKPIDLTEISERFRLIA